MVLESITKGGKGLGDLGNKSSSKHISQVDNLSSADFLPQRKWTNFERLLSLQDLSNSLTSLYTETVGPKMDFLNIIQVLELGEVRLEISS